MLYTYEQDFLKNPATDKSNCSLHLGLSETERESQLEVEVIKSADPFPSPMEESLTWDIYSSFVLQQSTEEPEAEVEVETEEGTEVKDSTTEDPLSCYNIDDVKSVLSQVTGEVLGNIQSEITEKLQKQEEAFTARINKLRKS